MRIEDFQYFVEIYKYGSINAAAKNNFISQAALSNILKNIEKEIGKKLFIRDKHGLEVTEYGRRFYDYALKISDTWQDILDMKEDNTHNSLSIIYAQSSFIAQCLFSFQEKYPCESGNDIFQEGLVVDCLPKLQTNKTRMLIGFLDCSTLEAFKQKCNWHHLKLEILQDGFPLFALVSRKHPLANRKDITTEEMFTYPLVKYKGISYAEELGLGSGVDGTKSLFVNNRSLYTEAIKTGNYISTTFYMCPDFLEKNDLVCIPIEDRAERLSMIYIIREDYELNEREKKFMDYFRCQLNQCYRLLNLGDEK